MDIAHLLSSASFLTPSSAPLVGLRTSASQHYNASTIIAALPSHHAAGQRLGSRLAGATCTMAAGSEAKDARQPSRGPPSPLRLVDIIRYPVKSCRGEALAEASVTAEGLEGDRRFMVTASDGRYQTQRELPALATVAARVIGDTLQLRAMTAVSARPPLNVRIRRAGSLSPASLFGTPLQLTDQGPEAASWLSDVIVGGGAGMPANPLQRLQAALLGPPLKLLRAPDPVQGSPTLRGGAGLSDLSPLLVVCEEVSLVPARTRFHPDASFHSIALRAAPRHPLH